MTRLCTLDFDGEKSIPVRFDSDYLLVRVNVITEVDSSITI